MKRPWHLLAFAALFACQRPFDSAASVRSLRVLAVQMDHPIPAPDTDVHLDMLWFDGSPLARRADGTTRPVSIVWIGGCTNPAGNLYYECSEAIAPALAALRDGTPSPNVGHGPTFTWHVPKDIVSAKASRGGRQAYGLSFVLYAACAGTVVPVEPNDRSTPPLACRDDAGRPVGEDGFVFGYVPIYTYAKVENANPTIERFEFAGKVPSTTTCKVDAECEDGQACGSSGSCLPVVGRCQRPRDCPSYALQAFVDPSNAEPDPIATLLAGAPRSEQLYVEYYASTGRISGEVKLLVHPERGPVENVAAQWSPAADVGETRLFAVVKDGRGGASWLARDVVVR